MIERLSFYSDAFCGVVAGLAGAGLWAAACVALANWAMPVGPGSISLRSTEPLRVSSAHAVTIPIANE